MARYDAPERKLSDDLGLGWSSAGLARRLVIASEEDKGRREKVSAEILGRGPMEVRFHHFHRRKPPD